MNDRIDSNESEGAFNEFIESQLEDLIDGIVNRGDLDNVSQWGSDVIVEMDDIVAPTFVYGEPGQGNGGEQGRDPGKEKGKLRFALPFDRIMALIGKRLSLPNLKKTGKGKIKEFSHEFKTFGQSGVILDKKRTFKRALRTSIGSGIYDPDNQKYDIRIMRRDRRFKLPKRVEKPKFKAVVFYMGDISYSTHGQRLELEKRLVNFIHNWIDFNYGPGNVEHRFFVHDAEAYEVAQNDFYKVTNAGGTWASPIFDMIFQIAFNEYDTASTNFYGFYFGDGELFEDDAERIVDIMCDSLRPIFSRLGVVEVQPGKFSVLGKHISNRFLKDIVVRMAEIKEKSETVSVIQSLFR